MDFLIYSDKYFRSRPTSYLLRSYKTSADNCDYHYLVHARGNYHGPDLNISLTGHIITLTLHCLCFLFRYRVTPLATAITTRTYTYFRTICLLSIGVFITLNSSMPLTTNTTFYLWFSRWLTVGFMLRSSFSIALCFINAGIYAATRLCE